jgi:TusE/DsrC/DsvC family sulfur relay protein
MNEIKIDHPEPEVNEEGFLLQPEKWNQTVACWLAQTQEGIAELSEDHWKVIRFLRQYWEQHGLAPMIRLLCQETGFSLRKIYELFPSGPAKGACKVAGLPKPDGCV